MLTLIKIIDRKIGSHKVGLYKCDCGKFKEIQTYRVNTGYTKSCGCLRKTNCGLNLIKHKMSNSKEFKILQGMKKRCYNKNCKAYKNYGGRGITICDCWLESFENFYRDMGPRPTNKHQIERINNNDGYYKENCKWATPKEESRNKRNNIWITYKNETKILKDWSIILKISYPLLRSRIVNYGWDIERAFTSPTKNKKEFNLIKFNNKTQSVIQWGKEINIKPNVLYNRLKLGWSVEKTFTTPVRKHKEYEYAN